MVVMITTRMVKMVIVISMAMMVITNIRMIMIDMAIMMVIKISQNANRDVQERIQGDYDGH